MRASEQDRDDVKAAREDWLNWQEQSECKPGRLVAEAIAKVGATIRYLPPYSPDLNPIELAFSKLKAHLREYSPRTFDDLLKATANALSRFKPEHCAGWFRHAQYAPF